MAKQMEEKKEEKKEEEVAVRLKKYPFIIFTFF